MEQVTIKLYKNAINSGGLIAENAIFGDDVALVREKESDEMFYRDSIDGKFTFTGSIYAAIATNSTLEDKFYLVLYDGSTQICTGEFTKLDCSFDDDNGICVVNSLGQYDRYSKLLEGMNNKYNLVSLAPHTHTVRMKKRAILQIYIEGDSKVSNVLGNMSYEVSCTPSGYADLTNTYHFTSIEEYRYIKVPTGTMMYGKGGVQVDIGGMYYFTRQDGDEYYWYRTDNLFYFYYARVDYSAFWAEIRQVDNDAEYDFNVTNYLPMEGVNYWANGGIQSTDGNGYAFDYYDQYVDSHGNIQTYGNPWHCDGSRGVRIWARILSDKYADGHHLPATDMCENNLNYRYWYAPTVASVKSHLKRSLAVQNDPTPYGKNEDGMYYVKPAPTTAEDNVIPIGWSMWVPESYWYEAFIDSTIEDYDETFDLEDGYELLESIKIIAQKIDPTITDVQSAIIGSSSYSSLIPYAAHTNMYITPISNIKKTYYSTAAQRGDISLADMLGMLKKVFKMYWYRDDSGVIHIEHLYYFLNGMSYSTPSDTDICDITAIKTPMADLTWSYGTNKYNFDISDLKRRYEFNWGDTSTDQFNGYPLEIRNNFCENASTEPITVDNFIADLDFIIGSPNTLSDDLYALMMVLNTSTPYAVQINTYQIKSGTTEFRMQNGEASFFYAANLNKNLHLFDIDGDSVYANGIQLTAVQSTKRLKRQESITFPVDWSKAFRNYVTTGYGRCQIEHIEINMESKMATAKVIIP